MKLTYKWISSFIRLRVGFADLLENMSKIGLEVNEAVDHCKLYEKLVIAKILSVNSHPNSIKLSVCKIDNGGEITEVVCGANNVRVGLKAVLAPPGYVMPQSRMTIKLSKIRGVASSGMLCGVSELFPLKDDGNIIEIHDGKALPGMSYAALKGINNQFIDLNITPNRGDCLSVYGIARDLYAKGLGLLTEKFVNFEKLASKSFNKDSIRAELVDSKYCSEMVLLKIRGVNNRATISKDILHLFESVDIETRTALVNLSNFAMYEFGRPSHIYDANKIIGKISIRLSRNGEKFISLELKEYELPSGILVVSDDEKILSIAGVIGGESSKVDETTQNIIVEVANFCPLKTSKTVKQLKIKTESSHRFERRVDHGITKQFVAHLAELVIQHCGGELEAVKFLNGEKKSYVKSISVDFARIDKLYGEKISIEWSKKVLEKLGLIYNTSLNTFAVPSWRQGDIIDQVDIAEEIIRMIDFDKIKPEVYLEKKTDIISIFKNLLINKGFYEQITWSFIKRREAKLFADPVSHIILKNPISQDFEVMRPNLLPGLISVAKKNIDRSANTLSLMEVGKLYERLNDRFLEVEVIAGVRIGDAASKSVHEIQRKYDFFDVKSDLLALLAEVLIEEEEVSFVANAKEYYHPGKSASVYLGRTLLAYVGALHPKVLEDMDCDREVYAFELFTKRILRGDIKKKNIKKLYDLQRIKRDFAFLFHQDITCSDIKECVNQLKIPLLEKVEIFDIFHGEVLGGKKSVALSVYIQPQSQNLTEPEIKKLSENIISKIYKDLGGSLRS